MVSCNLFVGGGKLFLPCYTFHMFILAKALGIFEHYVYSTNSYTAPFFWVLVASLTMLASWLVMKIPYMDKVFRI